MSESSHDEGVVVVHDEKAEATATKPSLSEEAEDENATLYVDFAKDDQSLPAKWHRLIKSMHKPITHVLVTVARKASKAPKTTIALVMTFSVLMIVVGLLTNFNVDVNEDTLWSPFGSRPLSHYNWINDDSGFPDTPRSFFVNVHQDGSNVLTDASEGMQRVFEALDTVRQTEGYDEVCSEFGTDVDAVTGTKSCKISSPTTFWNNSLSAFDALGLSTSQIIATLSQSTYPDGSPVDTSAILGNPERDESTNLLTSAQVYLVRIDLPDADDTPGLETKALDRIFDLQDEWEDQDSSFKVEVFADRSFGDEFSRAIVNDIPLVPIVFVIMSIFTAGIFFRRDPVQSRMWLGFGAVVGVLLAIMTGYGLLFLCGVPFTSMTQILPFIMFGIGLDDAFILSGSFYRTDPKKDVTDRIEETLEDVGVSITLTTLTSALAFGLGCISTIPAVFWLCLYAFPTIIIDYIYQITFFVALMTLDERRVAENRRDCCFCCSADKEGPATGDEEEPQQENEGTEDVPADEGHQDSMTDRLMIWYADHLLKPWVKVAVVIAFLGLAGGFAYSASQLTQEFDFTEVIPSDSYITPFFDVITDYTSRGGVVVDVYFRDEDQSNPSIQSQMEDYVNDLVDMRQIDEQPPFFWLRDFNQYVTDHTDLQGKDFYEQFSVFFNDPAYNPVYKDHIVLDSDGRITASRTTVWMNNIDEDKVTELIDALEDQRAVSRAQPINKGKSDWSFFTFGEQYLIFQFYSVAVDELILTTILGVVSVSVLSMLFMPHWTAILFVAPFICVLYVDLLGVLQVAGIRVNPVSYISMVMSIGLLVDFIVHVLLRYFEIHGDRVTRTKEMLRTMGSSVMIGGISTFLGVIPLAFSTSTIFNTIFITFLGLVTLGMGHGLILLPVVLSTFGPESKALESVTPPSGKSVSVESGKQEDVSEMTMHAKESFSGV